MTVTAAIVLAAGEGTRMRSATPKVLHPFAEPARRQANRNPLPWCSG